MALFFGRKRKKKDIPSGLWTRCPYCEQMIYTSKMEEKLGICPQCNFHFTISARERIEQLIDEETWQELFTGLISEDPLSFTAKSDYPERLKTEQERTGQEDAAVVGTGEIQGVAVVLCVVDATFLMGSMGCVVGEKICRAAEYAMRHRLPLVMISGSGGGARMQEGVLSLMQMAKTSAALQRLGQAGLPYLVVLTNPTMGGSMASFASQGDVILAEPKALLGFTGPEVIRQTIRANLPDGFQRSEFLLEHGFVDQIVDREHLRETLARFCIYLNGQKNFPESQRKRKTTTRTLVLDEATRADS